jgi:hypothetical protein
MRLAPALPGYLPHPWDHRRACGTPHIMQEIPRRRRRAVAQQTVCSRIKTVGWVRRPQIDLLPAEQPRRNPSSIFALPTGTGINRPMGIAALNAILRLLTPTSFVQISTYKTMSYFLFDRRLAPRRWRTMPAHKQQHRAGIGLPQEQQTAHSPCRSCFSCESGQRPPHKQKHRAGVESPADKTQTYKLALTNQAHKSLARKSAVAPLHRAGQNATKKTTYCVFVADLKSRPWT